jgi:plasmid stabilization system protein ParE
VKVVYTAAAVTDLSQIGDWIAGDSPRRAESFVDELVECCSSLSSLPRRWPLVPRFERLGVRRRPLGDYLIFYRPEDEQVTILRILHGARDYEAVLFPNS